MRIVGTTFVLLAVSCTPALALPSRPDLQTHTVARLISYRAHNGERRNAWLLLPAGYHGERIPLVISPHGRGLGATANARLWSDLPGLGHFAVVNPLGEGRRLGLYSWGDRGQIEDLARMPQIVARQGVRVDRSRVYAFGGSMGAQETLLLVARHPHLLAGAAAFDPATNMARRYRAFARLKYGADLQRLAREEVGGTPLTDPGGYAERSPARYARRIAFSGVPLQLFWSTRDRMIADQKVEAQALADRIVDLNPQAKLWAFHGQWAHTAEMRPFRRLPHALARFGLLSPWIANHVPLGLEEPGQLEPRTEA